MDNTKILTDKQLKCRVWGEVVRNFIFLTLIAFISLPVIFVLLYTLFGSNLFMYIKVSAMTARYWKYTAFIYPTIRIFAIVLALLFFIYLVLSKIARDNNVKFVNVKQGFVSCLVMYPELWLFGLTFVWITLTFFLSGDLKEQSGFGLDVSQGYIYYVCYGVIFTSFFATTKKQKSILLEAFIIIATIISLLAVLFDGFGLPRLYSYEFERTGIFSNQNYFGYFLAISTVLPVARMYKERKIVLQIYYAICLIINEFALLITLTRGAFVGAIFGIILVLVLCPIQEKEFNIKLIIIPMIIFITFLVLEITGLTQFFPRLASFFGDASTEEAVDTMSSGRIEIWKGIIEQIKTSPIIGVGIGNTPNPHNEFLQTAAWHGIPACLLYIAALATTYIKAIKNNKNLTDTQVAALAGTAGYIVSSFFGNGLLQTIPSYIIILALCFNISIPLAKNDDEKVQDSNVEISIESVEKHS